MPVLPHFAWPMRFETRPDGTVGYTVVEQDSDAEHNASAAVIASTPRGHRDDNPSFGVTPLPFNATVDPGQLAAEISQSDERLELDADELIDLADATRRTVRASVHARED